MANGRDVTPQASGRLVLATLGRAALLCVPEEGPPVEILGPGKPHALLIYLACSPGRTASREHLIDLLWADLDPEAARHSLRQAIWFLRQRFGDDVLIARDGDLTLCARLECDRAAFLDAVERRESERAVELYQGDFLPGFAAPGGADFEHWADLERLRLRRLFRRAGETVARDWLAKGRLRRAVQLAGRVRDADPDDESGWRLLLEALLAANNRVGAELEVHRLEETLAQAERRPEPATTAMLALVRQLPLESAAAASRQTLTAELIGREREFSGVLAAWDAARRRSGGHVHVTGAPGLGKSRLLADVRTRLRSSGARVVLVRANPGERAVSCALAADLAAALAALPGAAAVSPGSAAVLVGLNPSLSSRYQAPGDHASELDALRRREIAIAELLDAVADEQPLALLIDDVHWADDASQQIVGHLLSHAVAHPVLVVTAARPGPSSVPVQASTVSLALEPLSAADTGALLASLGRLPSDPWAERLPESLQGAARGTPLLILETLHLLIERGILTLAEGDWACADATRLAAELAQGGALRRRIAELSRHDGWLLVLLATAGTPLSAGSVARAADRDESAVQADLASLEVRGLVSRDDAEWQTAHDEIAARALDLATPDARRSASATLGRQLAARRHDAAALYQAGQHLGAAGEEQELSQVLTRLVLLHRRRGEPRSAHAVAARLVGAPEDSPQVSRLVRRVPVLVRLGVVPRKSWIPAAAAALLGIAGVLGVTLARGSTPVPDVLLTALRPLGGDSSLAVTVPLRLADWEVTRPLALHTARGARRQIVGVDPGADPVSSPDGNAWAVRRVVASTGGLEIFLHRDDGHEVRLTDSPEDDIGPNWSPDGRRIVLQTVRWNHRHRFDLAILDLATGSIRALTRNDYAEGGARWSPDGTRIAFRRGYYEMRPEELCWITVDGRTESCFVVPGYDGLGPIGWYSDSEVLATGEGRSGPVLLRVSVETRNATAVHDARCMDQWRASPDGRWIACARRRPGYAATEWSVYPTERPELARHVSFGTDSTPFELVWRATSGRRFIDRVDIGVASHMPLDAVHHLLPRGYDQRGDQIEVPIVSWRTSDSSIADVDSTGTVHPRRTGSVTIHASAGGWREDSVLLTIVPPGAQQVLTERWTGALTGQWVPFGVPDPVINATTMGRAALWHRGDSTFHSGVYSRRAFDARRGLGVEAVASTPLTELQWQSLYLQLDGSVDETSLERWDHVTGSPPHVPSGAAPTTCGLGYPGGDGFRGLSRVGGPGGHIAVDSSLRSGQWFTIRLQIFPDGRCAVAIDGKPIARAETPLDLNRPYRVLIEGKSVRTRILVGPLDVWEGVKGDVDWSLLDRPGRQ